MDMPELNLSMQSTWQSAREVRERIESHLRRESTYPEELRRATAMTASELVENAVRYGHPGSDCGQVQVGLRAGAERVEVTVQSACTNPPGVKELAEHIDRLGEAKDKGSLYLQRLETCLERPRLPSQLGLYRIGFEGQFDLEYTYDNGVVTVRATRRVR